MGKRLRLEDKGEQEESRRPPAGTEVNSAVDLSRSKWVYGVRWEGAERLRLSTGSEIKHLQALARGDASRYAPYAIYSRQRRPIRRLRQAAHSQPDE